MSILSHIVTFFAAIGSFLSPVQFKPAGNPQVPTYTKSSYAELTLEQLHDYAGASILPRGYLTLSTGRDLYFVLGRETAGVDRGFYDDFGGGRLAADAGPYDTAAREFCEEAIAQSTMGMSKQSINEYINIGADHTKQILIEWFEGRSAKVLRPYVTFITEFEAQYFQTFMKKFYKSRAWSFQSKYLEKDCIALVSYNNLMQAINTQDTAITYVTAYVVNPKSLILEKQSIPLRPFFVHRMHHFMKGTPHKRGASEKILVYKTMEEE